MQQPARPLKKPIPEPPTKEAAAAKALNEQGYLLAHRICDEITNSSSCGWRLLGSEYPVTAADGSETKIDHVLSRGDLHLTIECKRAHPMYKRWLFFHRDSSSIFIEAARCGQRPVRSDSEMRHDISVFAMPNGCCCYNYYLECAIDRQNQASSAKTIEEAFQQVMRGHSGLMAKLLSFEQGFFLRSIPVVITTAEMLGVEYDLNEVSLELGMIEGSALRLKPLEFCAVTFHADNSLSVGWKYNQRVPQSIESDMRLWQTRTIFVVSAPATGDFLTWAGRNLTDLVHPA